MKRKRSGTSAVPGKTPMASTSDTAVFDKATKLAVDHLIYDEPSHLLYQRNLDQFIDAIANTAKQRGETGAFPLRMNSALALLHRKDTTDEAKAQAAEHKILQTWTKRTMRELATGLAGTKYPLLSTKGGNLKIEDVSGQYKCELRITPLINIDDDMEAEAQPKAKKRKTSAGGKGGSSSGGEPAAKKASANGSASRGRRSQQFATPQDSNGSESGNGGSGEEDDEASSEDDDEEGEDDGSEETDSGSDSD